MYENIIIFNIKYILIINNIFKIYSYVYNLNFFILIRVLMKGFGDIVLVKGFIFF